MNLLYALIASVIVSLISLIGVLLRNGFHLNIIE